MIATLYKSITRYEQESSSVTKHQIARFAGVKTVDVIGEVVTLLSDNDVSPVGVVMMDAYTWLEFEDEKV